MVRTAAGDEFVVKTFHANLKHENEIVARDRRVAKVLAGPVLSGLIQETVATYEYADEKTGEVTRRACITMPLLGAELVVPEFHDPEPNTAEQTQQRVAIAHKVMRDVLQSLAQLATRGLSHGDVRAPNIVDRGGTIWFQGSR